MNSTMENVIARSSDHGTFDNQTNNPGFAVNFVASLLWYILS